MSDLEQLDNAAELAKRRLTFASPRSALRAAARGNPRSFPCPTCGKADRLTARDKRLGYQCDECADREEGCW